LRKYNPIKISSQTTVPTSPKFHTLTRAPKRVKTEEDPFIFKALPVPTYPDPLKLHLSGKKFTIPTQDFKF